jgi:hypothetical protein
MHDSKVWRVGPVSRPSAARIIDRTWTSARRVSCGVIVKTVRSAPQAAASPAA